MWSRGSRRTKVLDWKSGTCCGSPTGTTLQRALARPTVPSSDASPKGLPHCCLWTRIGQARAWTGIYSAAREVDEASLFREAERLAGSEVTRRRSRPDRGYAERAIRKAAGFAGRYSVPPWMRFDFLCRIAAHRRHPGAYAHLLGLWPIDESAEGDTAAHLDASRRFVDHLLGPAAASLTIPARVESLRLAEPTLEQRRELDRFLHDAEAQPLLPALDRLAGKPQLWVGPLSIGGVTEIRKVELVPWRSTAGRVLKWSGLKEPQDAEDGPPVLILRSGDAADSGDYSKLEVRWKAQPAGLEKNAADYRIVISTDLDEELAAREVRHSARGAEKCRFSDDDFSALDEDSVVSAKVVVSVVGNEAIQSEASEDFIIRFGEQEDPVQGGVGRTVRTFSEGLIELGDRDRVSAVAAGLTGTVVGSRGFVTLRQTEGQRSKSFRVVRPNLINEVESQWIGRSGSVGRWRVKVRAAGERIGVPEFVPFEGLESPHLDRVIKASRDMAKRFSVVGGDGGGGGVAAVYDDQSKAGEAAREYVLAWTALLDAGDPSVALCNTVEVQSLAGQTIGIVVLPAHPLRVAWHAAYDNLVLHTAFVEQEKAKIVRDECGILDGALFPAFLPNPAGGGFCLRRHAGVPCRRDGAGRRPGTEGCRGIACPSTEGRQRRGFCGDVGDGRRAERNGSRGRDREVPGLSRHIDTAAGPRAKGG